MKTMQHGGPLSGLHRCIVFFGASAFAASFLFPLQAEENDAGPAAPPAEVEAADPAYGESSSRGESAEESPERELHDYAKVYVDRYFEPEPHLTLTEEGVRRSRALSHFALGRALEAQGRPAEAVEAYKVVIENAPEEHFLARKTAFLLARNGRNDEALKLLEDNLDQNPRQPFAYITLGEFLHTYHQGDEARQRRSIELFEEAAAKFPEEAAVYEPLVQVYLSGGRSQDALALMRAVLDLDHDDPAFWLQVGRTSARIGGGTEREGETAAALVDQMHLKALSHAGDQARILETVADYFHESGQFEQAAEVYRRVVEAESGRIDVREKLARVYEALEDEAMVLATLEEILQLDSENVRSLKLIAQIHMRNERFTDAIPYLRKSLSITKGSPAEYRALAQMMMETREYEQAVDFLEDAAAHFPEVVDFAFFHAVCLSQLKRYEEAVAQFERTVELSGGEGSANLNERFYFSFAAANERMGEIERAAELFQKSIDLISENDPDHSNQDFVALVYNYLGYMWLENDLHIEEAGELIKTAIALDPENGAITDSLGWYQFKTGRYEEAKDTLLRAAELIEEPDPVVYDHIGQAYFKLGRMDEAVDYLERAVDLDPENEELDERLEEYRKAKAEASRPEESDGEAEEELDQLKQSADPDPQAAEQQPGPVDLPEESARANDAIADEAADLPALEAALQDDPENVRILKQIAQIHMRDERFAEAIPYLRKSVSISKGSPAEYGALAQMMMETREYEQAVDFLGEASSLHPEVAEFAYYSAVCLSQLNRYEEAVAQFERAVELYGGEGSANLNERFYFSFAAANERMGEIERAAELFQKSIDLISENDPDHSNQRFVALVYNYLGYMLVENDLRLEEAGKLIKTAIALDPENGAITDSLGWYQFKTGRYEEAKDTLLRAAELIEEPDPVVYDHIAQAHFQLGQMAEAVDYLERAVDLDPENEELGERLEEYRKAKAEESASVPL